MNFISQLIEFIKNHFDSLIAALSLSVASIMLWLNAKALGEHNRPYISFSIESNKELIDNQEIVIKNTGNRIAEEIDIMIEPELHSYCFEMKEIDYSFFKKNPIKFESIAPGQEIKTSFDLSLYRFNKKDRENNNHFYLVTIQYKYLKKHYKQSYPVDISYMRFLGKTVGQEDINKNIKQIADSLEDISKRIKDN